jgi:integrase/recombinase XerD
MGKKLMEDALNFLDHQNDKTAKFVMDKIFHPLDAHFDTNSLSAWLSYYYSVHVKGAPEKTEQAKTEHSMKTANRKKVIFDTKKLLNIFHHSWERMNK